MKKLEGSQIENRKLQIENPLEARWMRKLMRDPFQLLLKKVRAGEFITPAFFHKCTIPHSYHCFQRYHFRPNPFDQYMKKHKVPLRAPTATQLHKMTLSALSRLAKSAHGHSEPAAKQREESNLFRSPSEFSFSSVSKNVRSFGASVAGGTVELRLAVEDTQTAQPSFCHPGLRAGIQFATNVKLKTNNSKLNKSLHTLQYLHGFKNPCHSVSSVVKCEKSNPKLDNHKTFFSKVPDT